jgi:hypothetical protein
MTNVEIHDEVFEALAQISREHNYSPYNAVGKLPHGLVETTLLSFGVAEAATAASLILSAWPLIFPRDGRRKCPHSSRMSGARCRARIVHTSYNATDQELEFVCEAHHRTVERRPRIYR